MKRDSINRHYLYDVWDAVADMDLDKLEAVLYRAIP